VCCKAPPLFIASEVLKAVVMKSSVFWYITPCTLKVNGRFGRTRRLYLQGLFFGLSCNYEDGDDIVSPKRRLRFNWLQGILSHKMGFFTVHNCLRKRRSGPATGQNISWAVSLHRVEPRSSGRCSLLLHPYLSAPAKLHKQSYVQTIYITTGSMPNPGTKLYPFKKPENFTVIPYVPSVVIFIL
jgi:hypothetical protein